MQTSLIPSNPIILSPILAFYIKQWGLMGLKNYNRVFPWNSTPIVSYLKTNHWKTKILENYIFWRVKITKVSKVKGRDDKFEIWINHIILSPNFYFFPIQMGLSGVDTPYLIMMHSPKTPVDNTKKQVLRHKYLIFWEHLNL